jgi:hypothetical protein
MNRKTQQLHKTNKKNQKINKLIRKITKIGNIFHKCLNQICKFKKWIWKDFDYQSIVYTHLLNSLKVKN